MRLTFLGKETQGGGSPTLYATDRDTYVVQGWKVDGDATQVEIPHRLLGHVEIGKCLGAHLNDTGQGSFILSGERVVDADALTQMDIPGHETCVEVPTGQEVWVSGTATGRGVRRAVS
jgi:hypothetical protein